MKHKTNVIHNGVFYPAGADVPAGTKEGCKVGGKQYSKSEIQRMSTENLKTLAPTLGIDVTEESTGAKLKEEIIARLGL